jgi:hypothetical protein
MRRWWIALLVALALVGAACSSGDDDDDAAEDGDEETSGGDGEGWTILHYTMGDTDLEPFLMQDINEMGTVGSADGFNLVAMIDRGPEYGDDDALDLGSWVGAKVVQINEGGTTEVIEEYDDLNLGDPETLSTFVADGIEAFPAAHYGLIISDHGASWPGVGPDETSGFDTLLLEELHASIGAGLEEAGVEKLDLLGFDACLMATYEVASTLAPLADRLVASSELEPGHGWDYTALQVLADDPSTDVDTLGTALVDGFEAQAQEAGTDSDITLSLVDLTQMDAVDGAMGELTAALIERADTVSPVVGRTLAVNHGYGRNPDPSADTFMTDLGALVAQIGIEALDVSDQADAVMRAINDAVVHKIQGPAAADYSGLSIYFPPVEDYFKADYSAIPANPSGWGDFLSAYYAAGSAIPIESQPTFTTDDATVTIDEEGLTIEGIFDAAAAAENVASASIEYGLVGEDGSITYIGDEQATVSDDGSGLVSGFYDLTTLNLTDGIDTALAYLTLSYDDDQPGFDLSIPLAYYEPGAPLDGVSYQDILLEVVVDDEQNVTQETYFAFDPDSGTYGEATLEPDGLLVPQVLVYDAEGNQTWAPTSDVGLYADLPNILYDFPRLESGSQLYIELVIVDFGGNRDSVSALVTIP